MAKVDELSTQLKEERMKSLDLEKQLQASSVAAVRMQQVTCPGVLAMPTFRGRHRRRGRQGLTQCSTAVCLTAAGASQ